jgi:hypothetical protein
MSVQCVATMNVWTCMGGGRRRDVPCSVYDHCEPENHPTCGSRSQSRSAMVCMPKQEWPLSARRCVFVCSPSTQQLTIKSVRVLVYACPCVSCSAHRSKVPSTLPRHHRHHLPRHRSEATRCKRRLGRCLCCRACPNRRRHCHGLRPTPLRSPFSNSSATDSGHTVAQCMRVIRLWRSRTQWIEVTGSLPDNR